MVLTPLSMLYPTTELTYLTPGLEKDIFDLLGSLRGTLQGCCIRKLETRKHVSLVFVREKPAGYIWAKSPQPAPRKSRKKAKPALWIRCLQAPTYPSVALPNTRLNPRKSRPMVHGTLSSGEAAWPESAGERVAR